MTDWYAANPLVHADRRLARRPPVGALLRPATT